MSLHLLPPARYHSTRGASENELPCYDEFDSNNAVFKFLYQILLEEEGEEDGNGLSQEAIAAAERSFYEALTDKTASSPNSTPPVPSNLQNRDDVNPDSSVCHSALQFMKGAEEGLKFLPDISHFFAGSEIDAEPEGNRRSRKNARSQDGEPEDPTHQRNSKQSATDINEETLSLEFDRVLLYDREDDLELKRRPRIEKDRRNPGNAELESLLSQCAEAIMENDRTKAFDLLAQIRVRSSITGNGTQRMAGCFADALEVRLTGCSTKSLSSAVTTMPRRASELLKIHYLVRSVIPFESVTTFFTNKRIMNAAENATKLHVVDFGIFYGFKWPLFIQQLASRPGGPPKLRITGIDLPQPGLRPNTRVQEAGRLLENYASRFRVPFEFHSVIKKWETVELSDIKMEDDEILVVNSSLQFYQLSDEVVGATTPRDMVLNLIRRMNPAVFVFGIYNSAHGSSFFSVRFREAMYHYGAVFDMLDTILPSEMPARKVYEEIFATQIMNSIALEGPERIERPETARVWHQRISRAGFRHIPIERETMKTAKAKMASSYHEDFLILEDRGWVMQGWRGRVLHAISGWQPI